MATVTIYTTPTCAYCRAAKEFMQKHGVQYAEIDVARDRKQAQLMVEKSGQMGVPVIAIEKDGKEEIMTGFDQAKLLKALEIDQ